MEDQTGQRSMRKSFQLTMDISKLDNKVKELVQKIAIDEKEKREQK